MVRSTTMTTMTMKMTLHTTLIPTVAFVVVALDIGRIRAMRDILLMDNSFASVWLIIILDKCRFRTLDLTAGFWCKALPDCCFIRYTISDVPMKISN
eukprot:12520710-Ditylum_brightwellii.AAC.1